MTQAELAQLLGVGEQSTITKAERGVAGIFLKDDDLQEKLATALKVPLSTVRYSMVGLEWLGELGETNLLTALDAVVVRNQPVTIDQLLRVLRVEAELK
jgi:transcriptional regulator with XRE-family HTH domain